MNWFWIIIILSLIIALLIVVRIVVYAKNLSKSKTKVERATITTTAIPVVKEKTTGKTVLNVLLILICTAILAILVIKGLVWGKMAWDWLTVEKPARTAAVIAPQVPKWDDSMVEDTVSSKTIVYGNKYSYNAMIEIPSNRFAYFRFPTKRDSVLYCVRNLSREEKCATYKGEDIDFSDSPANQKLWFRTNDGTDSLRTIIVKVYFK